jgi:hypothetical protein
MGDPAPLLGITRCVVSNPNSKPGLVLNLAWKKPAKGRLFPVKFKAALSKMKF